MDPVIASNVKYKIVRKIADGGMGSVYEAVQEGVKGFKKTVAIKTVLPKLAKQERFSDMFIEEAKLVSNLIHENVVQIYHLDSIPDGYYMVLEYIHGLSLQEFLKAHRERDLSLPVPLAVFIASRVARGLAYAHSRSDESGVPMRIVHRDVSPNNVLITSEGLPKLMDFGLAFVGSQKSEGKVPLVGKLGYISPEQARREQVDFRSDIFSLGALLFELLSGVQIRRGIASEDQLDYAKDGIVFWEGLPAGVHSDLQGILQRCLAKNAAERYESTARLARDLEYFIYKDGYGPTIITLEEYLRPIFPALYRERA